MYNMNCRRPESSLNLEGDCAISFEFNLVVERRSWQHILIVSMSSTTGMAQCTCLVHIRNTFGSCCEKRGEHMVDRAIRKLTGYQP